MSFKTSKPTKEDLDKMLPMVMDLAVGQALGRAIRLAHEKGCKVTITVTPPKKNDLEKPVEGQ